MYGQLVECETADGIRLDGFLHTPSDSARQAASEAGLQLDVMILHHGVGGNFYRYRFVRYIVPPQIQIS